MDRYKRRLLIANFEQTANLTVAVYAPLMASYMMEFRKKMPGVAKTSHIKALAEQPTPGRVDGLNKLRWSLFVATDGTFILGDIGPVCKSLESGSFEYLPTANDTESLILPISHNRAIIGSREGSPGDLNSDAVNEASAALSSKFFISDRDSTKERRYLQVLGAQSRTLSRAEMAKILEEILVPR